MKRDLQRLALRLGHALNGLRTAFAIAALTSAAAGAWALPADYGIDELYHTQWTVREGVPTGIAAMVQTPDGFLWLGSPGGLFRFDGVSFERFSGVDGVPLLSQDIYSLNVAADGALWIGHHLGGVSRLHQGRLVNHGPDQGLPRSSVSALGQDGDGTLWAGTTRGLYRLDGGRWTAANSAWHVPTEPVDALVLDRDRTLWVMSADRVYFLRKGAARFETFAATIPRSDYSTLVLHPDGTAMVCMESRVIALTSPVPSPGSAAIPGWTDRPVDIGANRCAFDRQGQLWFGGLKGGGRFPAAPDSRASTASARATRATRAARPETTALMTLTGTSLAKVLEDREGNIWMATRSGLDRIRAPALRRLSLDVGAMEYPLASARGGGVWIGTSEGNLFRSSPGAQEQVGSDPRFRAGIDVLYTDPSGTLWAAADDSILQRLPDHRWRRSARRGAAAAAPNVTGSNAYSNIEAMTQDTQGGMWVSVLRVGVYRVVGDRWTLWGGRADMPGNNVTALFTDARGRVWFGYDDGRVSVLDGDRLTTVVAPAETPPRPVLGEVSVFVQQGETLWIGTQKGLWRLDEGLALRAVEGTQGPFIGVVGIVPTASGDLWLSTVEGAVRLDAAELPLARGPADHRLHPELLDYLDGLPGVPDGAEGNDGRIWFATVNGVVWMDPSRRPRNTVAPTVVVKAIVADGTLHPFSADEPTRVPMRTHDLKIVFTAPSLTMPERVRFRYRLADADDAGNVGNAGNGDAGWQDIGNHREVYFRDLAPGRYRFQVTAANNDGVWSDTGASVEVVIPPAFVQTPWFIALCVIAVLGVLWMLSLMRLRAVNGRLRLRLEERMVERERIARELHDTFLQAVQGLMLRFHSAMERIPPHEPARELMEHALDSADDVIALGRDAVLNLREPADLTIDLAADLQLIGDRWSQETGVAFVADVRGEARDLDPTALQECQRLATEALNNAFRHAEAAAVRLDIDYTSRCFTLQVWDDGRGFDTSVKHAGRWGLVGMRERAARMKATLEVRSEVRPDVRGTTVRLRVPARVAYRRTRRHWLQPLQRLTGATSWWPRPRSVKAPR